MTSTPIPPRSRGSTSAASLGLYRPLVRSSLMVLLLFVVGSVGYGLIGGAEHGWLDALYMTVVTLTTTGYTEIIDLTDKPLGRVFTMALLLCGVGAFVYFFSNLTAFLVEGEIQHLFRRRRMSTAINKLSGHVVICGGGHSGEHAVRELAATGRPHVLVERDEDRVEELRQELGDGLLLVVGDAGEDEVLQEAGIERASGLVACVSSDKDNLMVTVSARILNPGLRIVCRCIDDQVAKKMRVAGADAIVSPNRIGGLRMVSELVRPAAVSYLDVMLRHGGEGLRVESTAVGEGSEIAGRTLGDLRAREVAGLLILALRRTDGSWEHDPADDATLDAGSQLVYVGPPSARTGVESLARSR